MEWDGFTNALKDAGISLQAGEDSLIWAGGDASRVLSVKNIYSALIKPLDFHSDKVWVPKLWKWPLPLKLKLFLWLVAFEKVLTCNVFQR